MGAITLRSIGAARELPFAIDSARCSTSRKVRGNAAILEGESSARMKFLGGTAVVTERRG
jgi:hypothetical protein